MVNAPFFLSLLLLHFCCATKAERFITTATGRQVPFEVLSTHLPLLHTFEERATNSVYELTDDNRLIGFDINLHVFDDTEELLPSDVSVKSAVRDVNGQIANPRPLESHLRTSGNLVFAFTSDKSKLLMVHGKRYDIVPVYHEHEKGLFINRHSSDIDNNLENDAIEVPEGVRKPMVGIEDDGSFPFSNTSVRQAGSCVSGNRHFYEIIVAYDNTFCSLYNNEEELASGAVQGIVNMANIIYKRDTCLEIVLVRIDAHCNDASDPYAPLRDFSEKVFKCGSDNMMECANDVSILLKFRDIWEAKPRVERDAAFFLSGFVDGSSTVGLAFLNGACSNLAYGWVEGRGMLTFAHELGHTLGATHVPSGLMQATVSANQFFSTASTAMINSFVDSPKGNCLKTSRPRCDRSCPGRCVDNKCITGRNVPSHLEPCTPIKGNFYCTFPFFNVFLGRLQIFAVLCDVITHILRVNNPADPNIFCCLPPTKAAGSARFDVIRTTAAFESDFAIMDWSQIYSRVATITTRVPCDTPPLSSGKTKMCAAAIPKGLSFSCVSKEVFSQKKGGVGPVKVTADQSFGVLKIITKLSGAGTKIKSVNLKVSLSSSFGSLIRTKQKRKGKKLVENSVDPFKIIVKKSKKSCCKMTLHLKISINMCKGTNCVDVVRTETYELACMRVCPKGGSGTVNPFTSSLRCPTCST